MSQVSRKRDLRRLAITGWLCAVLTSLAGLGEAIKLGFTPYIVLACVTILASLYNAYVAWLQ